MAFPVDAVLPALEDALADDGRAVLTAPPGAGKTTRVPLALLDAPWLAARRIVMLEPRRLAARAAASYMAAQRGEAPGRTVGYRTRLDTRVSAATRIEVVTEGVLTRMLQADPSLEGVGLVVFDEFHERSVHADLGLALTLQARDVLRADLRVLVMSATLETAAVAKLLDNAPVIAAHGRAFDVVTHYLDRPRSGRLEDSVALAVRRALHDDVGDVLAFLPGAAEIRRTAARLDAVDAQVIPLFGNLTREEQDRAIAPAPPGQRKVVLATSIAETSLTIDGVRIVVDGGLQRVPRFSPRTGMTRLETVPVTRASADQRRGRAGRTAPGVCYRLWTRGEDTGLRERNVPEILEADLAPLALELAAWGVADAATLRWIDPPPPAAFAQARELLGVLGALDADGHITTHGRRMAEAPAHPRLAHMILAAAPFHATRLATTLAALLSERDVLRGDGGAADPELHLRLHAIDQPGAQVAGHRVDRTAVQRVRDAARQLQRRVPPDGHASHVTPSEGVLLALAYPDRIGKRRDERGRFLLRNGRGASVDSASTLASAAFLVAADLDGRGREANVRIGAPLDEAEVRTHFATHIETDAVIEWNAEAGAVRALRRERLGAITLAETALADPDPEVVRRALLEGVTSAGAEALPWSAEARSLQLRMVFLHTHDPAWPDVSDTALLADLAWLEPWAGGVTSLRELQRVDMKPVLLGRLDARQRAAIDRLAPTHITVPSGSSIAIDYSDPAAPVLAVRLQELFGWSETPRIADGHVPLVLHILSPARRPVQVTRDLASFWKSGYFDVRRDLRGRYPKHHWPEDPTTATATRGVRRRR